jgi:hypothetical protein
MVNKVGFIMLPDDESRASLWGVVLNKMEAMENVKLCVSLLHAF